MNVQLRPLREDEFEAWVASHAEWYAADMVSHGGFDPAVARTKAEADTAALFPEGFATDGISLMAVEVDGVPVGSLCFGQREHHGSEHLFLYAIDIDSAERGKGYGREAMRLLETAARAQGLDRIELNVFGGNATARRLYGSLGYAEAAVYMRKELE